MNEAIEIKDTFEAAEQEAAKPYTFRKLCAKDVFPMTNIIKKIGIKEFKTVFEGDKLNDIMAAFSGKRDDKSVEAVGFSIALELADIILGNLEQCEDDIFKLLAQTSDLEISEVENLDLAVFAEMVIDFIKKEDFKDFFKVVSKSFK